MLTLLLLYTLSCPFLIVAFINAPPLGIVLNVITVEARPLTLAPAGPALVTC